MKAHQSPEQHKLARLKEQLRSSRAPKLKRWRLDKGHQSSVEANQASAPGEPTPGTAGSPREWLPKLAN